MSQKLTDKLRKEYLLDNFIGEHPSFLELKEKLSNIANLNVSVLLIGETGSGKELCAEFLHQYGNKNSGPFIPYNCSAGPESLFDSQIFGHAKGAYTGADIERKGLVEEANSGILFLDEINSLNLTSQVKLTRFLETGSFRRLGETNLRYVDVRIIAASNKNLKTEVENGNFRADLYYRLAEYELVVPPLRERGDDIVLLANYFLDKYKHLGKNETIDVAPQIMEQLKLYTWPGNIRELEHFIKKSIIDNDGNTIKKFTLPSDITQETKGFIELGCLHLMPWRKAKNLIIEDFEKKYLIKLLKIYRGNVAKSARQAGVNPPDFWKLLKRYDLKAKDFKNI